jgi:RimJ/RimL family protein N-acetyltransferase
LIGFQVSDKNDSKQFESFFLVLVKAAVHVPEHVAAKYHAATVPRFNPPIAYRLRTNRLVIRGWTPEDAPALWQALVENLQHLRQWLPWVALEPEPVEDKLLKLQQWRAEFDRGEQFRFGIYDSSESRILGSIGLHNRIGAGALEIGYWMRADSIKQGFTTEAAAAMVRLGFQVMKLRRMEIHCHPSNIASAGVPRKLSFEHRLTIVNKFHEANATPRDTSIWVMRAAGFEQSEAAKFEVQAVDALGRSLM